MRRLLPAAALVGLLAACGSSGSSSIPITTVPQSTNAPPATIAAIGTKPVVTVPATAPTTLQVTDLVVGTGAAAKAGDQITVQYVGVSFATKQQFDASWDSGQPFGPFPLGQSQVIPGWDQGLVGMKVGGRRQLIIPPDLAYGGNPPTPKIAANDTLIFVVDLLKIG